MNVEQIERLAKTVRNGHHRFDQYNVAFSMRTIFAEARHKNYAADYKVIPDRIDLPDVRQYNASACLIGFTLFLCGKKQMLISALDSDFNAQNCMTEAQLLLDLEKSLSRDLFLGSLSQNTTGDDAYRVIRKLLVTGHVDWMLPYR